MDEDGFAPAHVRMRVSLAGGWCLWNTMGYFERIRKGTGKREKGDSHIDFGDDVVSMNWIVS